MKLHIALLEPEIPQNTGNIARTCVALGAVLHLIKPLGFSIDDKQVKRAGLDYWEDLDLKVYEHFAGFLDSIDVPVFPATTKALNIYSDINFGEQCCLLFGKESAGIPEEYLIKNRENCFRIPMKDDTRSLNLSNAAAIAAYEVYRQHNFLGLKMKGELHRHMW